MPILQIFFVHFEYDFEDRSDARSCGRIDFLSFQICRISCDLNFCLVPIVLKWIPGSECFAKSGLVVLVVELFIKRQNDMDDIDDNLHTAITKTFRSERRDILHFFRMERSCKAMTLALSTVDKH